jgi:hypothetical protein
VVQGGYAGENGVDYLRTHGVEVVELVLSKDGFARLDTERDARGNALTEA